MSLSPPLLPFGKHPGSLNTPLTSLISAFIFPPLYLRNRSIAWSQTIAPGQSSGSIHMPHAQRNINHPRGRLVGTDVRVLLKYIQGEENVLHLVCIRNRSFSSMIACTLQDFYPTRTATRLM